MVYSLFRHVLRIVWIVVDVFLSNITKHDHHINNNNNTNDNNTTTTTTTTNNNNNDNTYNNNNSWFCSYWRRSHVYLRGVKDIILQLIYMQPAPGEKMSILFNVMLYYIIFNILSYAKIGHPLDLTRSANDPSAGSPTEYF